MSVELPPFPGAIAFAPALMDFGGFLTPASGGAVQRIDRMGNRHRASFTFPPMDPAGLGRVFVQRFKRAKTEGLLIEVPLLGFEVGPVGQPVVDGAGQAGRTLNLRGFTPHYAVREGQWLSVLIGGRRYLYSSDAQVIAGSDGRLALPLSPMLRKSPPDGAVCEFTKPMLEGIVRGEEWGWEASLGQGDMLSIAVEEQA